MALHPTRNDLSARTRGKIRDLLTARRADAIDLASQVKQAHWKVKGPQFITGMAGDIDKQRWLVEAQLQADS